MSFFKNKNHKGLFGNKESVIEESGGNEEVATSGELRSSLDKLKASLNMELKEEDAGSNTRSIFNRIDGKKEESKRIGKLCISNELVNDYPEEVQRILDKAVLVKYQLASCGSYVEYIATSERFEIVEDGKTISLYLAVCVEDGRITIERMD